MRRACLSILAVFLLSPFCFAETRSQQDGLFRIDVPECWHWFERPGYVMITNPERNNSISIQFIPMHIESDEKAKEILKEGNQAMTANTIRPFLKGNVISDIETDIDGVYARKLDYLFPSADEMEFGSETVHGTYLSLFHKDYTFAITFGALQRSKERSKMEKILDSFRLQ
jgi:hypothetical protein